MTTFNSEYWKLFSKHVFIETQTINEIYNGIQVKNHVSEKAVIHSMARRIRFVLYEVRIMNITMDHIAACTSVHGTLLNKTTLNF